MQKIVLVTYFFDENSAASQRILTWCNQLFLYNLFPIIIANTNESNNIIITKHYEIHLISNKKQLFINRLTSKSQILATFLEPFWGFSSTDHLYRYLNKLLKHRSEEIKLVVTSVCPFSLIRYGFYLRKKYPIKWIIDYRDMWTYDTHNWFRGSKLKFAFQKLLKYFNLEANYLTRADAIITLSPAYPAIFRSNLYFNNPIYFIPDGYRLELFNQILQSPLYYKTTIAYNGTVYNNQNLPDFIKILASVIQRHSTNKIIRLVFIGTQYQRIQKWLSTISVPDQLKIICLPRLKPEKVLKILNKSHLHLIADYASTVGIIPTKVYDSIGLEKPILLYNTQPGSALAELVQEYGNAYIAFSKTETSDYLTRFIDGKLPDKEILSEPNKYARSSWMPLVAQYIKNHLPS